MDDRQARQGQSSRHAGLRALPTPTDVEVYVDDAPPLLEVIDDLPEPRIADLDALLREVDALRSTMRRDLMLAATAAEAGETDLAGWLLLGEDGAVRSFEQRALAHLAHLDETHDEDIPRHQVARRAWRILPAAPFVAAAAAVIGVLAGVVPGVGGPAVTRPTTSNTAMQSYAQLTQLATNGAPTSKITDAAKQFHAALAPLVASGGANPDATEKAIALLQSERAVIAGEGDSPALRAVLAQADALVRTLQATLPRRRSTRIVVPPAPVPPAQSQQHDSSAPKTSPKPTPSPTPSPAASPKASPTPSPSPAPSRSGSAKPSPSEQGPIPHSPGVPH